MNLGPAQSLAARLGAWRSKAPTATPPHDAKEGVAGIPAKRIAAGPAKAPTATPPHDAKEGVAGTPAKRIAAGPAKAPTAIGIAAGPAKPAVDWRIEGDHPVPPEARRETPTAPSESTLASRPKRVSGRLDTLTGRLGQRLFGQQALPIRWRLTLVHVVVLSLTLSLFSLVVYWYMGRSLVDDMIRISRERASQVEDNIVRDLKLRQEDTLFWEELNLRGLRSSLDPFQAPGVGVRVFDSTGQLKAVSAEFLESRERIPDDRMFVVAAMNGSDHLDVLPTQEGEFLAYSRPVIVRLGPAARPRLIAIVQMLTSMAPYHVTMGRLQLLLALSTLLAMVLALFTGTAVAQAALAPIGQVTRTAERIVRTQDLSQRVTAKVERDELGRLVATVNEMLSRIQAMFDRERHFLADVSHELRTPLTTIRGEIELMERSGQLDPEAIDAVRSEAERMSRMVGDLLLLTRAQSDGDLTREPVELASLLLEVFRQARTLAGEHHTVNLVHEDVATVSGDRDRLKQLFLNLIENAIRYTPAGSSVGLALYREPAWARIEISDNGPGIPAEDLPHIFERFYRVDKARDRASGGTGLGLSIVRWIATAHHGTVSVASKPGEATTFTIRLPLAE